MRTLYRRQTPRKETLMKRCPGFTDYHYASLRSLWLAADAAGDDPLRVQIDRAMKWLLARPECGIQPVEHLRNQGKGSPVRLTTERILRLHRLGYCVRVIVRLSGSTTFSVRSALQNRGIAIHPDPTPARRGKNRVDL